MDETDPVQDDGIAAAQAAFARIEAALARIEAAAGCAARDHLALQQRHQALRQTVEGTLADLDTLIAREENNE